MGIGKMKKIMVIGAIVAGCVATVATAGPTKIEVLDKDLWGGPTGGGPYEVSPIDFGFVPPFSGLHGAAAGNFVSFCIEEDENISEDTYFVDFNTAAVEGGVFGPNPDPLKNTTAYLYTMFNKGMLDDLITGSNSFVYETEDAGVALQRAIWHFEENRGLVNGSLAADLVDLANTAVAVGGDWYGKGIGHVRVLNVWGDAQRTINKQDILVMIPLPASVWMSIAGLGLVGCLAMRRRREMASLA